MSIGTTTIGAFLETVNMLLSIRYYNVDTNFASDIWLFIQKLQDKIVKLEVQAQKAESKGKPDKAIDHFKKAWDHAQKAIKHATK